MLLVHVMGAAIAAMATPAGRSGPAAWSPPALITVARNATPTELFAAASLESRLRTTLGLAGAHVAGSSASNAGTPQLAVGHEAALQAGIAAAQMEGLGDDGYILLSLKHGGVAMGTSKGSARGSMNAVYLLRGTMCHTNPSIYTCFWGPFISNLHLFWGPFISHL